MAFDREGAYWLQDQEKILNPYEGENMPHCGSIKASYLPLEKAEVGKLAQVREIDSPYFKLSFHKALEKIIASYLVIHSSLTQDKFPPRKEVKAILDTLHSLKPEKLFPQGEREQAQEYLGHMHLATRDLRGKNLPRLRRDFLDLSENLIQFIRRYGHSYPRPLYLFFCPGYRQKLGGHWLQSTDKINNPYMSDMPKCGQLKDTFAPHSVKEKMKEKFHVK